MNDSLLVGVAAPLLLAASVAAGAQSDPAVQGTAKQGPMVTPNPQIYVHPDPEIPLPTKAEGRTEADRERQQFEKRLWEMFGRGEYAAVRRTIAERREKMPGWQPPVALTVELNRAEVRAEIAAAKTDPGTLLDLSKRHPEQFTCSEYYNLWSLADAQVSLGEKAVASEIHHQMLTQCRDAKVLLTTLDRIADAEGPGPALEGLATVEKRNGLKLPADELEQRRYQWNVNQAVTLHGEGKLVEAAKFLAAVESTVIKRRDLGMARLIAWNYRERGESAKAAEWFERVVAWSGDEEDRLHLLQLKWDAGDHAGVIDAMKHRPLKDPRARIWAAEVLRGEAARVFDTHAYADSVALLDAALLYDKPEPPSIAALRGWACLDLQRYAEAQRAFADVYHTTHDAEIASGLLFTAQRGGDWNALLTVANSEGGPLLSTQEERDLATQLAEGKLVASQITVEEGRLAQVEDPDNKKMSAFSRAVRAVEGFPGYTWGSLDADSKKATSFSYIVNQGVDWVKLPGDITLNSYLEYRALNNDWRYLQNETEGAVGLELKRSPFHLGVEHLPEQWRRSQGSETSSNRAFFSWYYDWYEYLRRRRGGGTNPLNVDAYAGSTYGRVIHDMNGHGGTSVLGFVKQGVDWFTFDDDITFHTFAAFRFRFRNWDDYYYDSYGPAIGMELQKSPFSLGVEYDWKRNPQQHSSSKSAFLYLKWYYGWDLKPE